MRTRNLVIVCIALIILAIIFDTTDFGDEISHEVDEAADTVEDAVSDNSGIFYLKRDWA